MPSGALALRDLLHEARACRACDDLPLGPNPVLQADVRARLLIVGQAPGTRVHASGIPWNDPSGDNLRDWMNVGRDEFYDPQRTAIIPMGLCYPGRGRSGDLPPRQKCAPLWHPRLRAALPNIELTLLIGRFAQEYYLDRNGRNVSQRVRDFRGYLSDGMLPLPHPSPRNRLWLRQRPWFFEDVVPELRRRVRDLLAPRTPSASVPVCLTRSQPSS